MEKLLIKPIVHTKPNESVYKFYIGVSSDQLLILQKKQDEYVCVEYILQGMDNNGTVLSAPNEDIFLEAISVIKKVILSGKNPFDYINLNQR